MNEDVFNASLRGFLKKVGITSQREIEKAVRDAVASGKLKGNEKLPAKMVLTIGGVSLSHEITDEIELVLARFHRRLCLGNGGRSVDPHDTVCILALICQGCHIILVRSP